MKKETLEHPDEIIEFRIPPPVGDRITFGEWVFDTAFIGVNLVFMLLWAAVCFVIWMGIGVPLFCILWLIASFVNILTMPFRGKSDN